MDNRQQQLLDCISHAFDEVELGNGVSLHETQILDNYGTPEERLAAREPDEKHDWRRLIDDPELTRLCTVGNAGLCFFDAAGFRFHLPACLSRIVSNPEDMATFNMLESLLFQLTHLAGYQLEQLAILNDAQRACVREVLTYLRDQGEWEDEDLNRALAGYWSP